MESFIPLLIWLGLCFLVGQIGKLRGFNVAIFTLVAFALSVLFSLGWGHYSFGSYEITERSDAGAGGRAYIDPYPFGAWPMVLLAIFVSSVLVFLTPRQDRKACPDCGESIPVAARFCHYCRRQFEEGCK